MPKVKDVAGLTYPATREVTDLTNLIGSILGSPKAGDQVLSALFSPNEKPTPRNVQTRLRVAIAAGAIPGLTANRLSKLQAALELGRQLFVEETQVGDVVDTPELAAGVFQSIAWEPVEKFAVATLNIGHRLLSLQVVSSGTATETVASPRDIFSAVLKAGGTRCIVAHNHPSGSVKPSSQDIALTQQLLVASKVMDILLLDHLILSQGTVNSLRTTTTLWKD